LTPQNDNVIDASLDFKTPVKISPIGVFGGRIAHNNLTPNSGILRIFLDQNPTSSYHIARITSGNEVKEFGPTSIISSTFQAWIFLPPIP
jgi:beta-galactosidase